MNLNDMLPINKKTSSSLISQKHLSAIVLAGGFSSRMGSFKPLLPIAGQSAIIHVVKSFIKAGISDIKVVTGFRGDEIAKVLDPYPVEIVPNSHYETGMYSSVQKGVASLDENCEAFFLLPVDYPLIKSQSIRKMTDYWPGADKTIIYPIFEGRKGHPPLISADLIPKIITEEQPDGLRSLLRKYRDDSILIEVDDMFINMDMDDQKSYLKLQFYYNQALTAGTVF